MSDPASTEPDDDDLLAAEYVLGLVDGDARRRVERRVRNDAALARCVEAWETRLAPLLAACEPAAAPAGQWPAIEADLDRMARSRPLAAAPSVGVAPWWRWFGLGSFGLLAASLAALAVVVAPRASQPPLAALIAPESGPALYAAVIDPHLARATLVPVAVESDPAHSRELWLIAPDTPPRSLGLMPEQDAIQIVIAPKLLGAGYVLAISQEPLGGSPTGQPTGPVVGQGSLEEV